MDNDLLILSSLYDKNIFLEVYNLYKNKIIEYSYDYVLACRQCINVLEQDSIKLEILKGLFSILLKYEDVNTFCDFDICGDVNESSKIFKNKLDCFLRINKVNSLNSELIKLVKSYKNIISDNSDIKYLFSDFINKFKDELFKYFIKMCRINNKDFNSIKDDILNYDYTLYSLDDIFNMLFSKSRKIIENKIKNYLNNISNRDGYIYLLPNIYDFIRDIDYDNIDSFYIFMYRVEYLFSRFENCFNKCLDYSKAVDLMNNESFQVYKVLNNKDNLDYLIIQVIDGEYIQIGYKDGKAYKIDCEYKLDELELVSDYNLCILDIVDDYLDSVGIHKVNMKG